MVTIWLMGMGDLFGAAGYYAESAQLKDGTQFCKHNEPDNCSPRRALLPRVNPVYRITKGRKKKNPPRSFDKTGCRERIPVYDQFSCAAFRIRLPDAQSATKRWANFSSDPSGSRTRVPDVRERNPVYRHPLWSITQHYRASKIKDFCQATVTESHRVSRKEPAFRHLFGTSPRDCARSSSNEDRSFAIRRQTSRVHRSEPSGPRNPNGFAVFSKQSCIVFILARSAAVIFAGFLAKCSISFARSSVSAMRARRASRELFRRV
jgi:hypothetical protein